MYTGQGNRQPEIDAIEHDPLALAKRSEIVALNNSGTAYVGGTIFDYVNSNPLGVVLVDTNGDAYVAGGGGGGPAANVSAYISGSIVYTVTANIATGTLTANVGLGTVTANVVGTVTAQCAAHNVTSFIAASAIYTVTANVVGTVTANLGLGTVTASIALGTVTANIGLGTVTANVAGTVTAQCAAHNVTAFIAAAVVYTVTANIATGTVTASIALGTVTANVAGTVTAQCAAHNVSAYISGSLTLNSLMDFSQMFIAPTTTQFLVTLQPAASTVVCATNLVRRSVIVSFKTGSSGSGWIGGASNTTGDGGYTVLAQAPYLDRESAVWRGAIYGNTNTANFILHVWERW